MSCCSLDECTDHESEFEVNEDDSGKLVLTENQHSWNEQYALLLIDQPIGRPLTAYQIAPLTAYRIVSMRGCADCGFDAGIGFSYTNQKGFAKNDLEVPPVP